MGTAALWVGVLGKGTVRKGGGAGREKSDVYPGELFYFFWQRRLHMLSLRNEMET